MKRSLLVVTLAASFVAQFAIFALAEEHLQAQYDVQPYVAPSSGQTLPGFTAFGSLLFLRPGGGNLEYATHVSPLPLPSPHWNNRAIGPDFTPSFNVGFSCLLNDVGNDIQLSWTHLATSDSDSFHVPIDQFVGPSYEMGPDAADYKSASGSVDFDYDAVCLDIGQHTMSGGPVKFRFFSGIEYAHIGQDIYAHFASDDGLTTSSNQTKSQFDGAGPRLGMSSQFRMGRFDFLSEFAASALIGQMHSRLDFYSVSPAQGGGIPANNPQVLTSPNAAQIVPALQTKLGGGYTYNGMCGTVRLEGGYQAAIYMNAINNYVITEVNTMPVDQSIGVFLRSADHVQSNFTAHGPYASLSWMY